MFRLFATAAFASLLVAGSASAHIIANSHGINGLAMNALTYNALTSNALTSNSITYNALGHNALTATGSGLAELNGVAVEAVVLPNFAAK